MIFNTNSSVSKKNICHLQLKTDIRHFEMKKYQMEKNPLVDFRKLNVNL